MFKKLYSIFFLVVFLVGLQISYAQSPPEVLWYKFNETGLDSTQNLALPGSGSAWAQVLGSLSLGPTGQFGDALIGSGNVSSTDYVNTGWIPDLGTSDWTISLWLNNLPAGTALNYLFGGTVAIGWRCFYSGAAGEYGVLMRLTGIGGTDITVPGVGPGPSVLTFVYDSSVPTVYAYINGVLTVTQPQAAALNLTGSDNMKVGAYGTSAGMPVGSLLDEFRFYNRALDATEVGLTWGDPLPVEFTSFTASILNSSVTLQWVTATEINNSGFEVQRKGLGEFEHVGFVPGFGTTSEPKSYSFTDAGLLPGNYSYRLKQIDFDGTFSYSDVVDAEITAPKEFSLDQNYPNPFNPSTIINFKLAVDSKVSLTVFNILGEKVEQLLNGNLAAGTHKINFDASKLQSGVYFYKINAVGIDGSDFTSVKKMSLTK
jgi:Concanavalin A-like lectin/glucanases superfamily/Secretion system C-terminal sorting domain